MNHKIFQRITGRRIQPKVRRFSEYFRFKHSRQCIRYSGTSIRHNKSNISTPHTIDEVFHSNLQVCGSNSHQNSNLVVLLLAIQSPLQTFFLYVKVCLLRPRLKFVHTQIQPTGRRSNKETSRLWAHLYQHIGLLAYNIA